MVELRPARAVAAPLNEREVEARKDFAEARYEDALHIFASLFAEFGDPIYLRNVARCYQKLKRPTESIATFQEYLARAKVTPDERAEVQGYIAEMEALQKAQAAEKAEPAPNMVAAPEAAARPARGARTEGTPPAPATPSVVPPSQPGTTTLVQTAPDSAARSHSHALMWGGLGAAAGGIVLVGVGVGFGMAARSAQSDVENQFDEKRDADGRRNERLQWVAYGAGAAALAVGCVLFVTGMHAAPEEQKGVRVSWAIGPAGASIGAQF